VKSCWGTEAVEAADRTKDVTKVHESVVKPLSKDGSIMAIFKRVGKGKVSYSHTDNTPKLKQVHAILIYIYT